MTSNSWQTKFKIGDLVRIIEKVEFLVGGIIIQPGEIGLVVAADYADEIDLVNIWGIDYIVLIRGSRLFFFEDELELIETKINPTISKVKFVFLKK